MYSDYVDKELNRNAPETAIRSVYKRVMIELRSFKNKWNEKKQNFEVCQCDGSSICGYVCFDTFCIVW